MVKIAIVYHSGFGHTEVQAQHVHKGAASVKGVDVKSYKAEEIINNSSVLNDADGIIFGAPTYMGSVSAPFKNFMDATSEQWMSQAWKDKIAGGFTNSQSFSGDKLNSLVQMMIFSMQHGMIWAGLGQTDQSPEGKRGDPDAINRMGAYLGAMAQSENESPDVTPPIGDLKTAELLGRRIAEVTKKIKV